MLYSWVHLLASWCALPLSTISNTPTASDGRHASLTARHVAGDEDERAGQLTGPPDRLLNERARLLPEVALRGPLVLPVAHAHHRSRPRDLRPGQQKHACKDRVLGAERNGRRSTIPCTTWTTGGWRMRTRVSSLLSYTGISSGGGGTLGGDLVRRCGAPHRTVYRMMGGAPRRSREKV